jgi:hypothetical protein
LNKTNAKTGRVRNRATRSARLLGIAVRINQAGKPSKIKGGATSENRVCCSMWMLNRKSSESSCIGQSAPAHRIRTPETKRIFCLRVAAGAPAGACSGARTRKARK